MNRGLFRAAKRVEALLDARSPAVAAHLHLVHRRLVRDPTLSVIRQHARPGDTVVDVGANRGVYTRVLSRAVGAQGRVIAIEPYPPKLATIRRNCGRLANVEILPVALSDHAEGATLTVPEEGGLALDPLATLEQVAGPGRSIEVETRRLDDCAEIHGRHVRLIKCDVEGHEDAVFRGAADILRAQRPVVVAEIDQRLRSTPIEATFEQLASYGYDAWVLTPTGPRPLAEFDKERDQLDHAALGCGVSRFALVDFLFVRRS